MTLRFFGQYLVDCGEIDAMQLEAALDEQQRVNLSLGEWAIQQGDLSTDCVARVEAVQLHRPIPFGDLACELHLLDGGQVATLRSLQQRHHLYLGEALVRRGDLDPITLGSLLQRFKADQADCDAPLDDGPPALRTDPLARSLIAFVPTLAQRIARLPLKVGPAAIWDGRAGTRECARAAVRLDGTTCIGLAADARLAQHLAARFESLGENADAVSAAHAVARFLDLLLGDAATALDEEYALCEVTTPEPGALPAGGHAFELASTAGAGILVLDPA